MSRQQKRQELREVQKMENRLYTYNECRKMMLLTIKETESKYNVRYGLCLSAALSNEPFNFDNKMVCEVLKLLFDQVEGIRSGIIDEDQIKEEAEKLGVSIIDDGQKLIVDIKGEQLI
jgi:hypothetical protein